MQQVELKVEEVPSIPDGGMLVKTQMSLISTGTETICYRSNLLVVAKFHPMRNIHCSNSWLFGKLKL